MLPRKSAPDAVYCVELLLYTIILHIQLPLQDLICIIGSLMKLALWRKKKKREKKKKWGEEKHDRKNPVYICWEKLYFDFKRRGALKESDLRTTHTSVALLQIGWEVPLKAVHSQPGLAGYYYNSLGDFRFYVYTHFVYLLHREDGSFVEELLRSAVGIPLSQIFWQFLIRSSQILGVLSVFAFWGLWEFQSQVFFSPLLALLHMRENHCVWLFLCSFSCVCWCAWYTIWDI